MNEEIGGKCTKQTIGVIAAKTPVRATVNGRDAIVTANDWDQVSTTDNQSEYYLRARKIRDDVIDKEAEGTVSATSELQELFESDVQWDKWQDEN